MRGSTSMWPNQSRSVSSPLETQAPLQGRILRKEEPLGSPVCRHYNNNYRFDSAAIRSLQYSHKLECLGGNTRHNSRALAHIYRCPRESQTSIASARANINLLSSSNEVHRSVPHVHCTVVQQFAQKS